MRTPKKQYFMARLVIYTNAIQRVSTNPNKKFSNRPDSVVLPKTGRPATLSSLNRLSTHRKLDTLQTIHA